LRLIDTTLIFATVGHLFICITPPLRK